MGDMANKNIKILQYKIIFYKTFSFKLPVNHYFMSLNFLGKLKYLGSNFSFYDQQ